MSFMCVCTTRHWQTFYQLVQELNVCAVSLRSNLTFVNPSFSKDEGPLLLVLIFVLSRIVCDDMEHDSVRDGDIWNGGERKSKC